MAPLSLCRLEDAVGLLSGCLPVELPTGQVSLSDLSQKGVDSVDLSPKHLLPIVSSLDVDEGVDTFPGSGVPDVSVDLPGRACFWSVDFPATATQSCALLLYNLAALLAMEPQWHSSAHSYLALALPGLQLTPEELTNRRCGGGDCGDQEANITLLPVSAILLQIYLRYFLYSTDSGDGLVVSDGSGVIGLLHEHFGSLALANRFYSPSAGSQSPGSQTFGLSLGDLRQLVKTQLASLMPNSRAQPSQQYAQKQQLPSQQTTAGGGGQFQNNFWIMNLQQQQQQQQQQQHRYMNQWESPCLIPEPLVPGSSNTNLVTTGIITSTNESDWPPL